MEHPASAPTAGRTFSLGLKLAGIGLLICLLWFALLLIDGVRRDRLAVREQARAEVAQAWAGAQLVAAPVLVVPYRQPRRVVREVLDARGVPQRTEALETVSGRAVFLPEMLTVSGRLEVVLRRRGIFSVPVYEAPLRLEGRFQPRPASLGLDGAVLEWGKARVLVGLSSLRGIRGAPDIALDGRSFTLEPAADSEPWGETLGATVSLDASAAAAGLTFSLELLLQGSGSFALAPLGAQTRVELRSNWADPSFGGAALPLRHTVGADGFVAAWDRSYFGRGYPQQWAEQGGEGGLSRAKVADSACAVTLLQPVDAYRLVERALKYGVLFLVLVFANFFLFEVTGRLRIHPLQYLMVGGALVLFFLGYLALGEFVAPGLAYGLAAAASTALVSGYSGSVLRTGRRCLVVAGGLAATYGCLYFILQLEDFALLAGTAVLFVLLGIAMWATRNVDWYRAAKG